ncbi:hypothetical protein [Sorangium sp. So ce542]|uniref:hypothetical protein n=1 Tax=Sorangium sp. So ce542 TaxID=3133316 RepID=UPI003F61DF8F
MHHGPISKDLARGLKVLSERIAEAKIPSFKLDETLTIATWNIHELGRKPRRPQSLHYIAEIVGRFDLVSIVEVGDDIGDLAKVLEYLGLYWRVVFCQDVRDRPHGPRTDRQNGSRLERSRIPARTPYLPFHRAARSSGQGLESVRISAERTLDVSEHRAPLLAGSERGSPAIRLAGPDAIQWGGP